VIARAFSASGAVLILTACAASPTASEADGLKLGLARVETQCGVKVGTLTLGAGNLVAVKPAPDAKYDTIDCVFRELKKPEFADHIKLGFVGNEAYAKEEKE